MDAEVLASLGKIKANSLRIDLSVGKHDSGFTGLMRPSRNSSQTADVINFEMIDQLAMGLQSHKVCSNSAHIIKNSCHSSLQGTVMYCL